eukprot:18833-Heterococcus_DN1.PRE.1
MENWIQQQRTLLDQERSAERTEIADSIATLTALECQLKGLSVLSLAIKSSSTGLYGRTVLAIGDTKGRPLPAHQFSSGNEVTLRSTKGGAGSGSVTGVVGKVTDELIEVVIDDDAAEAEALKAPLRMDVLANEATHKKLLKGLDTLAHHGGGHAVHVINVLFGQSQPSLLSLADSAQQHDTDVSTSTEGTAAAPCTLQAFNAGLNDSQRAAVAFALSTDDVALMHGPPGTGKTTAVVELIQQAVVNKGWR